MAICMKLWLDLFILVKINFFSEEPRLLSFIRFSSVHDILSMGKVFDFLVHGPFVDRRWVEKVISRSFFTS